MRMRFGRNMQSSSLASAGVQGSTTCNIYREGGRFLEYLHKEVMELVRAGPAACNALIGSRDETRDRLDACDRSEEELTSLGQGDTGRDVVASLSKSTNHKHHM